MTNRLIIKRIGNLVNIMQPQAYKKGTYQLKSLMVPIENILDFRFNSYNCKIDYYKSEKRYNLEINYRDQKPAFTFENIGDYEDVQNSITKIYNPTDI